MAADPETNGAEKEVPVPVSSERPLASRASAIHPWCNQGHLRPFIGEFWNQVMVVGGAHSDYIRVGRREQDVAAVIAGGSYQYNPQAGSIIHRVLQSIVPNRSAQAQVDHPGAVVGGKPDAGSHIEERAGAIYAEHFDRHDAGSPRDAGNPNVVIGLRRSDAGHHGAVPEIVLRIVGLVDEIKAGHQLGRQVGLVEIDAGIEDGKLLALGNMDELRKMASMPNSGLEDIFLKLTGTGDIRAVVEELVK